MGRASHRERFLPSASALLRPFGFTARPDGRRKAVASMNSIERYDDVVVGSGQPGGPRRWRGGRRARGAGAAYAAAS
jgi:hypothetical protein